MISGKKADKISSGNVLEHITNYDEQSRLTQ